MTAGRLAADPMFFSVVMPAYNEEQAIETVVRDHFQLLEKLGDQVPRWEVVCVDDASRDRTPEILRVLSEREPRLRLVRYETNQGIFAAFTRCYREARGTHVYATGSDGQWPPENVVLMLDRLSRAVEDAGSCKLGVRAIFLFDLISKSPFFEAERIVRASREGYRVDFVPIRFAARAGGKATGGSWKNIRDSLRCLMVYGVRRR